MFEDLKNGIARPLAGMSLSFTASLFGLAGSLVMGFLDLQTGQAQSRFYTDLENVLATPHGGTPLPDLDRVSRADARGRRADRRCRRRRRRARRDRGDGHACRRHPGSSSSTCAPSSR